MHIIAHVFNIRSLCSLLKKERARKPCIQCQALQKRKSVQLENWYCIRQTIAVTS